MESGDVIVALEQKPHDVFERKENDLAMMKTIKLVEALCGFEFTIKHLDEREIVIRSSGDVIKDGDVRTVVGEGMPFLHNPMQKGNLHIKFAIEMPTPADMTPAAIAALQKVLPAAPDRVMPGADAEEVSLRR